MKLKKEKVMLVDSSDNLRHVIKDYLEKHPDKMEYRDIENPYFNEGYRRALEDFIYIVM